MKHRHHWEIIAVRDGEAVAWLCTNCGVIRQPDRQGDFVLVSGFGETNLE